MSTTKFSIAFCELHHPILHGHNQNSSQDIDTHYIATYVIKPEDFINEYGDCQMISEMIRCNYLQHCPSQHNKIRNYKKLVRRPEYFQPQLVQLVKLLPGNECVAIIKTYLIIRLQRFWRIFIKKRNQIIHMRMQPESLVMRETTGQWPQKLSIMPCLNK